jgi:hypothetical protein
MVVGSRPANAVVRVADHLGVGKGQRYRGSRVMPVEGRALTSVVFVKEGSTGD